MRPSPKNFSRRKSRDSAAVGIEENMYYARETSLHPEEGDAIQGSERKYMSCRAMRLQSVHNTGMHKHCEW
jgi:hypothetical protein